MTMLLGGAAFFALSLLLTWLTIRTARLFNLGADTTPGVQRFHTHWVPRLGGVPILLALAAWLVFGPEHMPASAALTWIVCLTPAFFAGLSEDLTGRVGPWARLLLTMAGAGLAWFWLDTQIIRLGPDTLDHFLVQWPLLSFFVTVLFAGGAAHALNIIDGYNGLASSYALVVLGAILIVATRVQDARLVQLSIGAIAATLGFFVLNFPYGRIFLGDSGSYLLGTVIAFLLIALVLRHPQVSPMFAAVLLVYPVWETLFSIYRRRYLRGAPTMQPDASHLHTLVHKRLVRSNDGNLTPAQKLFMNSVTTLYTLALSTLTAALALVFWRDSLPLLLVFAAFIAAYVSLYFSLVRFRAPRRLSIRDAWTGSAIVLNPNPAPEGKARNRPYRHPVPAQAQSSDAAEIAK